jgi:hypothetical protein
MAADRPYKVKNLRARKTLSLFGTLLAPQAGKGHGTTFLTEEQFSSAHVQTLIKMGRLTVLESPKPAAAAPAPKIPAPKPAPPTPTPPVPPAVPDPVPEPSQEEAPAPEPETDSPPTDDVEASSTGPEALSEESELPALDDVGAIWTEDELFALNADAQKAICRSRNLKVGGKEAERVKRILADQKED